MSDKIFLDSNVLVYCYSQSNLKKQDIARRLATKGNIQISTQVLNETANVLNKKYSVSWDNLEELISDFENNFQIYSLTSKDVKSACRISSRYGFSFYDSMIISAAIECNCNLLYSEDMQHDQVIDNKIKILNSFNEIKITNWGGRVIEFDNKMSADEYFKWMRENPSGYVLHPFENHNTHDYLFHRSGCNHIADETLGTNGLPKFSYVGKPKVCSEDIESLKNWLHKSNLPNSGNYRICDSCKRKYKDMQV